jgi:hypothetical protein
VSKFPVESWICLKKQKKLWLTLSCSKRMENTFNVKATLTRHKKIWSLNLVRIFFHRIIALINSTVLQSVDHWLKLQSVQKPTPWLTQTQTQGNESRACAESFWSRWVFSGYHEQITCEAKQCKTLWHGLQTPCC